MAASFTHKSTISVLLLGATGSLGSRILIALLERPSTSVTVVVRNRDKLNSILPARQRMWRQTLGPAPVSLPEWQLSIIEGNATDSDLLARVMREKSIRVLVNAAGHAPMFARGSSSSAPDGDNEAFSSDNEIARIVRASIDAVEEVAKSAGAGTAEKRTRGWFIGGMLLLDFPDSNGASATQQTRETAQSLDHYLPLYLHHRPVESMLRSSEHVDWTLVCPAKMIPRSQPSKSPPVSATASDEATFGTVLQEPLPYPSPALIASADVPPKWTVWPSLRVIPWGIGPLLEIIANSARYTVTFEDVAEYIVDRIVYENTLQREHDHESDQADVSESVIARTGGRAAEDTPDNGVWINKKIGLIASSTNT
ncbi:hypothetical protein CLAIMM_07820 [Cladophialophora immunda]|nr:hypothetical protein CLAIMM_07820 [Cladophialophora immunda]